jgi:NIPSNAP protein
MTGATRTTLIALAMFTTLAGALFMTARATQAQTTDRVFEIRTYTCNAGKLPDLQKRFREHTIAIFNRHHMTSIGYWTPQDPPLSENTLIYILAHPSREAAKANWEAFRNDPEWKKVQAESEANGKLVNKVVSIFANATDYSPLK